MAIERESGRSVAAGNLSFDQAVRRFLSVTVPQRVDMVQRTLGFDLFNRVTLATPVDTGWARGSWHLTRDTVDLSIPPEPKKGETLPLPTADLKPSLALPSTIYVSNNIPYIDALNNGHSPQAPAGFVDAQFEATKVNFETIVRQVVARDGGL